MNLIPGVFSMGIHTLDVSVDAVFVANRRRVVESVKKDQKKAKGPFLIFLQGGTTTTRYDTDHEPIFRQESYFWYLTGVKEPDCSISIDQDGYTVLFIPRLPEDYATIMGPIKTCDEWKTHYHVDHVQYTDEIDNFLLHAHETTIVVDGCPSSEPLRLLLLDGVNSDSGKRYSAGPIIDRISTKNLTVDTTTLFPTIAECRVFKSAAERHVLRHVTEVTSFAHAYVMRNFRPGMMEYQAESLFRHYCYYNYGCRLVGYTPICGCGPAGAILHYGHSGEPNSNQSKNGDMCLFDMGAEYFGYGSDVTCSFPVNGVFSLAQKLIYQAVLNAQVAVYAMMKPGVSYVDCHKAAEKEILKGLIVAGIVEESSSTLLEELVEMRLGAVFMPHGLGHFIGIDTHDVGGYLPGHPERIMQPGLKSLRTARVLQEHMVLTVEPGCYFIQHLLDKALMNDLFRPHLNAAKIDEYRGFGGVRIEDVVHVTSSGIDNFTVCPRTLSEIESVMAGGKWPPVRDEAPELKRSRLTDPTPLPSPPSL
jgi:Xaa-Pro dipeptidase